MNIGILGAGAWGSALAKGLSEFSNTSHKVLIYAHDNKITNEINTYHTNRYYFGDLSFAKQVISTNNINDLLNSDYILLATPVRFIVDTLSLFDIKQLSQKNIIICSKGLEYNSCNLVSTIVQNALNSDNNHIKPEPNYYSDKIMVLSGPSFANEFASGLPGSILIAGKTLDIAKNTAQCLNLNTVKTYVSDDIIGAQVGGALKNIIAIAAGIITGLELGHNALSAMISKGLNEIKALVIALGGKEETAYGLSGLGDLILTATSPQSRNFSLGLSIAKNNGYNNNMTILKAGVAEGFYSALTVHDLIKAHNIKLEICESVYNIIYKKLSLTKATPSFF